MILDGQNAGQTHRKALQALPSVTGQAYMIGDTCLDLNAAKAADIEGKGVLCGYGTRGQLRACTEMLFQNGAGAVRAIAKKR